MSIAMDGDQLQSLIHDINTSKERKGQPLEYGHFRWTELRENKLWQWEIGAVSREETENPRVLNIQLQKKCVQ